MLLKHAKSLQSFLTLCDPTDGSLPGSPVPGILQARTLEWVAISFSNFTNIYIYYYRHGRTIFYGRDIKLIKLGKRDFFKKKKKMSTVYKILQE